MYMSRVISVLLLCRLGCPQILTPVVETSQGRLRGLRSIAGVNRYYGIPYASCKRFQEPEEPPPFVGTFNAILHFGWCAQSFSFLTFHREDCLQLDVFTPENARRDDKLPVMVYFHGGAFYYGSKDQYNCDFIVTKNIVAVTVNYRVSLLGFLCLNGIANLGLKDQVAALKWIRKNIAAFGGDPDNVTLVGQSAGAALAGMHMLSDKSRGLFHKVILLSGTPLAPWAFNAESMTPTFEDVNQIAKANTIKDIYKILAKTPTGEILKATKGRSDNTRYFKYTPCVDSNLTDPFFRDTPYDIIKSGKFNKVPVMVSVTDGEGILFYGINDKNTLKDWDENFVDRLPSVFSWCSDQDKRMIAKKLREHYFGSKRIDDRCFENIIRFYSDWVSHSTVDAFSQLLTKYSDQPVYNYMFQYSGSRNIFKFLLEKGLNLKGASHSDDLFYIFKPLDWSPALTNTDKLVIDRLTNMLANFMKFGTPTPRATRMLPVLWPPSTVNTSHVMHIDRTLRVRSQPWPAPGFLLDMLCTYGQQGYVPCESAQQCNKGGQQNSTKKEEIRKKL